MSINLIGLGYKKQSGKNTVAEILSLIDSGQIVKDGLYIEGLELIYPDSSLEIHSFAENLKKICSILQPTALSQWEHSDFKESPSEIMPDITNRKLLQLVGDGLRKIIHPDIWIASLFKDYTPDSRWIITDVRMKNEADYIKKLGGMVVRVYRPGISDDSHISEHDLDDYKFDYTIDNTGSYTELVSKCFDFYDKYLKWK